MLFKIFLQINEVLPELLLLSMPVLKTVIEPPHDLFLHHIILLVLLLGILIKLDFDFIFHSPDMLLHFETQVLQPGEAFIS